MSLVSRVDPKAVVGRSPDRLTLDELTELTGKFVAMEIYTPQTLPLRRIEAVGDSVEECIRQLAKRGLDPRKFEFERLAPPY